MIPGSNLLRKATSVMRKVPVVYYRFSSRQKNAQGKYAVVYNPAVTVMASVQPIPRSAYADLGLDFMRNYITVFASYDFAGPVRDQAPDYLSWNGKWWQVESPTDWYGVDGWSAYICVEVTTEPALS